MSTTKWTVARQGHTIAVADSADAKFRVRVTAAANHPVNINGIFFAFQYATDAAFLVVTVYKGMSGGVYASNVTEGRRSNTSDTVQVAGSYTGSTAPTGGTIVAMFRWRPNTDGPMPPPFSWGDGELVLAGGESLDIHIDGSALGASATADITVHGNE